MPIQTVVLLAVAGVFGLAVIAMLCAVFFMIYTSLLIVSRSPARVRPRSKVHESRPLEFDGTATSF